MNIFVLDESPVLAAQYHCDSHVVKMITEAAQLLVTAICKLNPYISLPISKSGGVFRPLSGGMANHPCRKWVSESLENFIWLGQLGKELSYEYTFRYKKIHWSFTYILWAEHNLPNLPNMGMTPRPLCMPDNCKIGDVVASYREYYRLKSRTIRFKYTRRSLPSWI